MVNIDKKILIVDDDKNFLWILKQSVAGEGFSVISAQDGEEGLEMAMKEKPDLILLDILMPKMEGTEVAKKLKEAGADIPIIFLTNVKDSERVSETMEISGGMADYILKADIHVEDIINRIKQKLGV